MTTQRDPPRLRDSEALRAVLASAAEDEPTAAELKAVAAGLPLAHAPLATGAKLAKALRAKVVAGAVTVLVAAGVTLALALRPAQPQAPATAVPPAAPAPVAVAAPPPPPAEELADAGAEPVARPPVVPPPRAPSPVARDDGGAGVAPDAGPGELALLDEAFRALRASDPQAALAAAARHEAAFPQGAFVQERELIVVEALLALGRRDEANARGEAFLATYPTSSHRLRIEQLLGAADAG